MLAHAVMAAEQISYASCVHLGGEGTEVNATEGRNQPLLPKKATGEAPGVRPGGEGMRSADVPAGLVQPPVQPKATGSDRLRLKGGGKVTKKVSPKSRANLIPFRRPATPPPPIDQNRPALPSPPIQQAGPAFPSPPIVERIGPAFPPPPVPPRQQAPPPRR